MTTLERQLQVVLQYDFIWAEWVHNWKLPQSFGQMNLYFSWPNLCYKMFLQPRGCKKPFKFLLWAEGQKYDRSERQKVFIQVSAIHPFEKTKLILSGSASTFESGCRCWSVNLRGLACINSMKPNHRIWVQHFRMLIQGKQLWLKNQT